MERTTRSWFRGMYAAVGIAATVACDAPGSEPPGEPAGSAVCSPCRIALSKIGGLDAASSPDGHLPFPSTVVLGDRSTYLVSPFSPDEIFVFHHDGRFHRTIGASGEGPGEFRSIAALEVTEDTLLWVFDRGNRRLTVLGPDDEVDRTLALTPAIFENGALLLPDRSIWLNAAVPTSDGAGFPLHRLDADGDIALSTGTDDPTVRLDDPQTQLIRASTPSRRGGFWTARLTELVLERWDADGRLRQRITRTPRWMEPARPDGDLRPPLPVLLDLDEDAEGRLWVVGRTADPAWTSAIRDGRVSNPDDYGDIIVEVIDPADERLIARARLPYFVARFAADGTIFTYSEENESSRIDFWRIGLVQAQNSP